MAANPDASPTPTPVATPRPDSRLQVVFYPPMGLPLKVGSLTITASDLTGAKDPITTLNNAINDNFSVYESCVYDVSKAATAGCDPTTAAIVITTQLQQDPVDTSDPSRPAPPTTYSAILRAFDMRGAREIFRYSLNIPADAADAPTALSALNLNPSQLALLLGNAVVVNGQLELVQGYQPYVQLVPTLQSSNDPTYLYLVKTLLQNRDITTVNSTFNAGTISSGSAPLSTICGFGQRYFVYSVVSDPYPKPLSFTTRIETHATGELYDCTDMTVIGMGVDQHRNLLTTKSSVASVLGILATVFTRSNVFWVQALKVGPAVSDFVDEIPSTSAVTMSTADSALQVVVDNLCTQLEKKNKLATSVAAAPPLGPLIVRVPVAKSSSAAPTKAAPKTTLSPQDQNRAKLISKQIAAGPNFETLKGDVSDLAGIVGLSLSPTAKTTLSQKEQHTTKAIGAALASGQITSPMLISSINKLADATGSQPTSKPPPAKAGTPVGAAQASSTNTTTTAGTGGTSLVALDVGGFVAYQPKPIVCMSPQPNNYPTPTPTSRTNTNQQDTKKGVTYWQR